VVYIGTMAIVAPHRADVILPGCRLYRKSRPLRQHRGPVQMAKPRLHSRRGDAREELGDQSGPLSEVLARKLPYDFAGSAAGRPLSRPAANI